MTYLLHSLSSFDDRLSRKFESTCVAYGGLDSYRTPNCFSCHIRLHDTNICDVCRPDPRHRDDRFGRSYHFTRSRYTNYESRHISLRTLK